MVCLLPSGPVKAGSVEPKMATTGTRRSAARCIVPVSLVKSARKSPPPRRRNARATIVWPGRTPLPDKDRELFLFYRLTLEATPISHFAKGRHPRRNLRRFAKSDWHGVWADLDVAV